MLQPGEDMNGGRTPPPALTASLAKDEPTMPTPRPGFRSVQIAVPEHVHAALRREAFERRTAVSVILRDLIGQHLAGRPRADELNRAFEAGRRAERDRLIATLQQPAAGLPTQRPLTR